MKKNMGLIDRVIRTILAILFLVLMIAGVIQGTAGIILIVLAIIFLLTSAFGFCPLYKILGISTCKSKEVENNIKQQ